MKSVKVFFILVLICGAALAQGNKDPDFAPGDKVEVDIAGKMYPGVVVAIRSASVLTVRVTYNGQEQDRPVFNNAVKKVGVADAPTDNPFEEKKNSECMMPDVIPVPDVMRVDSLPKEDQDKKGGDE